MGDPNIIRPLSNFFYFIRNKRILLIGAGGGGDVCGCLPTYRWIQACGGKPILGSLTWERTEVFNGYGPRPFKEIMGLKDETNTVVWGNNTTRIASDGTLFQASKIAKILEEPIVFIDISKGVKPCVKDMQDFLKANQIDMVIALDVGGDIIARGIESGLKSPLADAMVLSIVAQITCPKALGIFGINCDGELSLSEIKDYLLEFNLHDEMYGQHLHSDEELGFMEKVLDLSGAVTEASRQPLRYYHGERGEVSIRNGTRKVVLNESITHTYFLRIEQIYLKCPLAFGVSETTSIEEANNILLEKFSLISEYEEEKRNLCSE